MTSRRSVLAAAALAAALAAAPAAPALAAASDGTAPMVAAAARDGYVRLAHMSPDTAAVNITLSSLSGDVTLFRLKNVGYGAVSKYMRLPEGTYALAMVPAGSTDPHATPVISGSIDIKPGKAETVAAVGLNKDLKTTSFTDDLSDASTGKAQVRIVQASVMHHSVDVTAGSTAVATSAGFGDVTRYTSVPAGSTSLRLAAGSATASVDQDLTAGSANTLFVIDDQNGDLTVAPAVDSAAATETPVGSLAAGGGGLAADDAGLAGGLAAGVAILGVVAGVALLRRRVSALGA